MSFWPTITSGSEGVACQSDTKSIVPVTLGEAADLEHTTIPYLCLAAVYQLLEEGKLSITDVRAAYQRGETSSSSIRNS
jgi:hypothetical protein